MTDDQRAQIDNALEVFDMDLDTLDIDRINLHDLDDDLRDISALVKEIRSGAASQRKNPGTQRRAMIHGAINLDEVVLTEAYHTVANVLRNGEPLVMVHGRAGTGKSTLIRYLNHILPLNLVILAPTGIAALNAGGQTIHSFCAFPPRLITGQYIRQNKKTLCKNLDLVIIDEISMVRADLLDGVDRFLRVNGKDPNKPFGGIQVLMVGDFYQLPPVVASREEEEYLNTTYGGEYFFFSTAFQNIQCFTVELDRIFRQLDPRFINLLNKIRDGSASPGDLQELNQLCVRDRQRKRGDVTLTCTNQQAAKINSEQMRLLPGQESVFTATITGRGFHDTRRPPAPIRLVLKEQAQVMFTRNDLGKKMWVNGTIGSVCGFEEGKIHVTLRGGEHNGKTVEVSRETWESIRYSFNRKTGVIEPRIIGTFTQFPIIPAWAVTIHKAQGQTFDQATIDLGAGAFSPGQLYVALSRCRSLDGLTLSRPIYASDVICDPLIHRLDRFLSRKKAASSTAT